MEAAELVHVSLSSDGQTSLEGGSSLIHHHITSELESEAMSNFKGSPLLTQNNGSLLLL